VPRIEVAGDISLRRPRPTQGCRTDDSDVDRPAINPLTPNDDYSGRTAPITSKR